MNEKIVLQATKICERFHDPVNIQVLKDIYFSIKKREFVSITDKSGCGKSTLLYILSTMDTDYKEELLLDQEIIHDRKEKQLARVRNEKIGFAFQFHYLLNEFTAMENVMLPGLKLGVFPENEVRKRAIEHLNKLNICKLAKKEANQLSDEEKQRVAIARALINNPDIIMYDEPTGNLDKANLLIVFDIFKKLTEESHQTLPVVTHDLEFVKNPQRIIEIDDRRIIKQ